MSNGQSPRRWDFDAVMVPRDRGLDLHWRKLASPRSPKEPELQVMLRGAEMLGNPIRHAFVHSSVPELRENRATLRMIVEAALRRRCQVIVLKELEFFQKVPVVGQRGSVIRL